MEVYIQCITILFIRLELYLEGSKQFIVKTSPAVNEGSKPIWNNNLYIPLPPFFDSCSSLYLNLLCDVLFNLLLEYNQIR